jgi:threonine/homoserine/homoserine lactone efflux protein
MYQELSLDISTLVNFESITLSSLGSFILVSLLLSAAPGPDNVFVLSQSMQHGKRAGYLIVAGLCTGLLGHTIAATTGIFALLQTSPLALNALKLLGASYLLYLAWQIFWEERKQVHLDFKPQEKPECSWRLYSRGIIMNISNPKIAVFFLAFFPQFTNEEAGSIPAQIIVLGVVFILCAATVFLAIATVAGALGERLQKSATIQRWLNRIAGIVLILLALHVALS